MQKSSSHPTTDHPATVKLEQTPPPAPPASDSEETTSGSTAPAVQKPSNRPRGCQTCQAAMDKRRTPASESRDPGDPPGAEPGRKRRASESEGEKTLDGNGPGFWFMEKTAEGHFVVRWEAE